jgi:nitrite reductase (NO-forming)
MTTPEQDASPGRPRSGTARRPRAAASPGTSLRDRVALGWLAAAVVIAIVHRWVPSATWLMIHLVLLGALTHSALVWSEHFAHTLLHTVPDEAGRRRQDVRIGLLGVGAADGVRRRPARVWPLVVLGATAVSAAVIWHAAHLVSDLRAALPSRFRSSPAPTSRRRAACPSASGSGRRWRSACPRSGTAGC